MCIILEESPLPGSYLEDAAPEELGCVAHTQYCAILKDFCSCGEPRNCSLFNRQKQIFISTSLEKMHFGKEVISKE